MLRSNSSDVTATSHVTRAAREAAPWVERLARLGYFAIGIVYALVGCLTGASVLQNRGHGADRNDVLAFLRDEPLGKPLLIVIAVALAGYALWKIISGIADSDLRGSNAKGLALRAGAVGAGIIYVGFMLEALHAATKRTPGSGSDASAKHWSAVLIERPYGRWILAAAGVAVIGAGIYQLINAWRAKLSSRLDLSQMRLRTRDYVIAICRFGIGARAVVFLVVGVSLVGAALHYDPAAARGTAGALSSIANAPLGQFLLTLVAVGFVAYGVYAFVEGRYRHIRAR